MLRLILDLLEHVRVSFFAISGSVPILIKPLGHCPCSWPYMSLCLAFVLSGAWPSSIIIETGPLTDLSQTILVMANYDSGQLSSEYY